jgi:hypothetical protein
LKVEKLLVQTARDIKSGFDVSEEIAVYKDILENPLSAERFLYEGFIRPENILVDEDMGDTYTFLKSKYSKDFQDTVTNLLKLEPKARAGLFLLFDKVEAFLEARTWKTCTIAARRACKRKAIDFCLKGSVIISSPFELSNKERAIKENLKTFRPNNTSSGFIRNFIRDEQMIAAEVEAVVFDYVREIMKLSLKKPMVLKNKAL